MDAQSSGKTAYLIEVKKKIKVLAVKVTEMWQLIYTLENEDRLQPRKTIISILVELPGLEQKIAESYSEVMEYYFDEQSETTLPWMNPSVSNNKWGTMVHNLPATLAITKFIYHLRLFVNNEMNHTGIKSDTPEDEVLKLLSREWDNTNIGKKLNNMPSDKIIELLKKSEAESFEAINRAEARILHPPPASSDLGENNDIKKTSKATSTSQKPTKGDKGKHGLAILALPQLLIQIHKFEIDSKGRGSCDNYSYPELKSLAKDCGVSRNTVYSTFNRLLGLKKTTKSSDGYKLYKTYCMNRRELIEFLTALDKLVNPALRDNNISEKPIVDENAIDPSDMDFDNPVDDDFQYHH